MREPRRMTLQPSLLLTDLYQLTMLQAYLEQGMEETAVFEFFVRRLPPTRGFLMAAGLEQLLDYLEHLHVSAKELEWLTESGRFSRAFVEYLERLRFTGDVHAMPEGTVFFPEEPIVRVTAPLPQAQLIETRLINLLHFQTLIASKAARAVLVAAGKPLVDFGLRRAHGAEAGLLAARASYLAGFSGTATVQAGMLFSIPLYGTEAAARKVVTLAPRLKKKGITIKGVRLDSGDLADHARKVRRILDDGGAPDVQIVASSNLDESALQALAAAHAPIDSFAVGASLTTSADASCLDCVYKLQEYAGRPRRKRSEGKATWPGRKQVYRHYDAGGRLASDVVTLADDPQDGTALVQPVMRAGRRLAPPAPISALRERAAAELARLPEPLRQLREGPAVPVRVSSALRDLAKSLDERG